MVCKLAYASFYSMSLDFVKLCIVFQEVHELISVPTALKWSAI